MKMDRWESIFTETWLDNNIPKIIWGSLFWTNRTIHWTSFDTTSQEHISSLPGHVRDPISVELIWTYKPICWTKPTTRTISIQWKTGCCPIFTSALMMSYY